MYLKQLYRAHKGWFAIIILFIIGQLIVNYKRGYVLSPFYHYGMYSATFKQPDTINLYEVVVNCEVLKPMDFSAQHWDKINVPLYYYSTSEYHNNFIWNTYARNFLQKFGINADSSNFLTHKNPYSFTNWYKTYLQSIVSQKIDSVKIYSIKATHHFLSKENNYADFKIVERIMFQ